LHRERKRRFGLLRERLFSLLRGSPALHGAGPFRSECQGTMAAIVLALAGLLLGATAIIGVAQAVFWLMLIRPSCDQLFDWVKTSFDLQVGPGSALNFFVIALALVCLVRRPATLRSPVVIASGGFLLVALASMVHSSSPADGARLFLGLATYAAVLCLPFALIENAHDAERWLKVALCSSFVPSLYAVAQLAMSPATLFGEERLESTFTHPNIFAFYLVGVVTLILFMTSSTMATALAPWRRLPHVYVALLFVLLLFTQTRSAWIAMAITLAVYAFIVDRRWLPLIFMLPAVLVVPGVSDRIFDLASGNVDAGYAQLNSYAWRREVWEATLDWMAANPAPILGYGLDTFQSYTPLFFGHNPEGGGVGAHNAILQIYFETGLAGLCSYFSIFVAIFVQLFKRLRFDFSGSIVMFSYCAGYLIVCFSDNLLDYLQFQWFFWFSIGAVCASTRYLQRASPLAATSAAERPSRVFA
jgi:O-antigen ligase